MTRSIRAPLHTTLGLLTLLGLTSCKKCSGEKPPPDPIGVPTPPRVTTVAEIGTGLGNGRALDVGTVEVSTSMKWTRQWTDKDQAVIAGDVDGEACALSTRDGGRTFTAYCTKSNRPLLTWSVGGDGTAVLTSAQRLIPKATPPKGTFPPIDALTFFFAAPNQKISAPADLLAPEPKTVTPLIPRGTGMAAGLGPSSASVVVELRPKMYAVAFSAGPGEPLPAPIELPRGEEPVMAPYGRWPQLLTVNKNKLWYRPWPKPGEALAEPKQIDRVGVTKVMLDDLSMGPECEAGAWSFRRVIQPPNRAFVLGISPDKTIFFELPETTGASTMMACSPDRVVVEAINPTDKLPSLVVCPFDGQCIVPQNRPFLKPWPEPHEREIVFSTSPKGVIAVQSMRTKIKWALFGSESVEAGRVYDLERSFGEGEGNAPDGYEIGALLDMGDRVLFLMHAKVKGVARRSWYVLATDDGGLTSAPP